MFKKFLCILLAVCMIAVLFGACGKKAEPVQKEDSGTTQETQKEQNEASSDDGKIVIGLSISGFAAPYFKAMVAAAEEEAKKQNVELKVLDAEWDTQKQASQVESLIAQKVDVIEIVPCDSKAIIPSMKKVKEAGIPLIVVNTQHDPEAEDLIVTFVGASMEEEAAIAAKSVKDILGEKGGNVVIIEGAAGSFPAIHRTSGFKDAIKDNPNIKILTAQNAGWDRSQAMSVMEDFLTRYPDINVVYAHDDNMAIGAIQAIKAAGRLNEMSVVSISGTIEGYDAIRNGELYSTVSQPPDWEGMMAVQAAVKLLNGEKLEKWIKTPIAEVTKENVDQFKGVW
ncbi:MAG TPA: sugar ABC transporter substrate-binding protein [Clostridiaceae bacterium]|nr:sugar ABC transporter substrate-binding protein [Clostridiaceae bacterium]